MAPKVMAAPPSEGRLWIVRFSPPPNNPNIRRPAPPGGSADLIQRDGVGKTLTLR